jgi:hypothetical protein
MEQLANVELGFNVAKKGDLTSTDIANSVVS